jgi:hypothetical protein
MTLEGLGMSTASHIIVGTNPNPFQSGVLDRQPGGGRGLGNSGGLSTDDLVVDDQRTGASDP